MSLACALLACRLLVALALIPPWQQPDEPSHVARVELQRSQIDLLDGSPDPAREVDILQSMAHYGWWEHRDRRWETPVVIPEDFSTAEMRRAGVPALSPGDSPIYFVVAGRLLSWLPRLSVVDDLYILRGVSALFGLLTLWFAWLGARQFFGTLGGATVTVLLALHSQFAVVSTAAAADALVNLLGAVLWWQTVLAVKRNDGLLPLIGVWASAIVAASTDRMGVPLLVFALIVSIVVARRTKGLVRPAVVGVGLALVAAAWAVGASGETYNLRSAFTEGWLPVPAARHWSFFGTFTSFVHQSWWFSLGWVRYAPPPWWTMVVVVLTGIAVVGTGRRLVGGGAPEAGTRTLIALAAIGVALQLSALYWTYFRLGHGAQGKSLFPVLIPCLVLLWSGIEMWVPKPHRVHAAAALVLLFALLDAAAWGLVALPAYYASF